MPREKLRQLQTERLRNSLINIYENVRFYKDRLDSCGVNPYKFDDLDDINKIPYTTKDNLRDNYPFGLFARSMSEVVRIHSSSGTTGNPTVVSYTKNDIAMWGNLIARDFYGTGVRSTDIIQNSYGYG